MAEPPKHRLGYEDTLNLTTSLCLSYVLCASVLRAWVRRSIYGIDDTVIAVAIVFCIGLFAASYVSLSHGAGKPWSHIQAEGGLTTLNSVRPDPIDVVLDVVLIVQQASIANVVTFTVSLYLSKCSVIAFLLRLTKDAKQILLYRASIALCAAIGLASVLLVTVSMPSASGYYWNFYHNSSQCSVQVSQLRSITPY